MEPSGPQSCMDCPVRAKSVFADVGADAIFELDRLRTANPFNKEQAMLYQGNQPVGVYCLQSGRVKLSRQPPNGSSPRLVGFAKPGDVLGAEAVLGGRESPYTVHAMENCQVCVIPKEAFVSLAGRNPSVLFLLSDRFSSALEALRDSLAEFSKPVEARLAVLLLLLAKHFGRLLNGCTVIEAALSRHEMAELIGTTQETVIRSLHNLRRKGCIDFRRRDIEIKDREALRGIARWPLEKTPVADV